MDPDWQALTTDPLRLADSILELHHAAQVVAAAGQAFAEPADDDSHRTLDWDAGRGLLLGAPWAPGYPFRVSLDPIRFELAIHERDGATLGAHTLGGGTLAEAYTWLEDAARAYTGGARAATVEAPEFAIPEHPVGSGGRFGHDDTRERSLVAGLFAGAFSVLGAFVADRTDASPVRLWPHHFDVGTVLTVTEGADGTPTRTVGLGMAPMGGGYDTWYWYVNAWPRLEATPKESAPGRGAWRTEGWTGAALPAGALGGEGPSAVRAFLDQAVEALIRASAARDDANGSSTEGG